MTPLAEPCREAQALIAGRLGLDFPDGRQADLERGLARALRGSPFSVPEAYLAWLRTLPDEHAEWHRLAGQLTVAETYFFRDPACLEALEHHVLPSLIAARRAEGILRLRLWSAGCASGEEAYSLAILLDRLLPDGSHWALTILGTDINREALEAARRGRYREWSFRGAPSWIRDRYFHRRGAETFEVDPRIRRMVTFAPLNLADDGYPTVMTNTSAMDLIICRNVLMYFTREAQGATVGRLRRALAPGGWLVVSPPEASAELFRPLVPIHFPGAIFYRQEPFGGRWPEVVEEGNLSPPTPMTSEPALRIPVVLGMGAQAAEAEPLGGEGRGSAAGSGEEEQRLLPVPGAPAAEAQPLLGRARTLADRGSLEQARSLCEAALVQDRLDPEAHILLAAICQEVGDLGAALEALRRAIYLAPDSPSAHFLLGSLLLRNGAARRGRPHLQTVVRLLSSVPPGEAVAGGDGLTAGRLLETARAFLEATPLRAERGRTKTAKPSAAGAR